MSDYAWMNEAQRECYEMLSDLCFGENHIGGKVVPCGDSGIQISLRSGFSAATFDFNGLTRAVVMAHDRCIRFEIYPSAPKSLGLRLHKRSGRDGRMHERHPTLESAVKDIRGYGRQGDVA